MLAFKMSYSRLLYELQPWIVPVTTRCNTLRLISDDTAQTIYSSVGMRSDERVTMMLNEVQSSISGDYRYLRRFVRALKKEGASVELVGTSLYNLYRKCQQ